MYITIDLRILAAVTTSSFVVLISIPKFMGLFYSNRNCWILCFLIVAHGMLRFTVSMILLLALKLFIPISQ